MTHVHPRIQREKKTVTAMIKMYCAAHHKSATDLCPSCHSLQKYAYQRLTLCTFGKKKPTCAKCQIHCYSPSMRTQIRNVMRYTGPRILLKYPSLAIRHMLDELMQHANNKSNS